MSFLKKIFGAETEPEQEAPEVKLERDFQILKDDGVRAKNMGELPYAVKCFQQALELKTDMECKSYLAELFIRLQEPAKALPLLKELSEADPDNIEILLTLAQTASDVKDWDDMTEACLKAEKLNADDVRVLYLQAKAAEGQKDMFTAIAKITQAIAKASDFAKAYELRARILLDMGQTAEAVKDTNELLQLDAENEEYLLLDGDANAAAQNTEKAEAAYLKIKDVNPFNYEGTLHLIAFYQQSGQMDKALHLANELIEEQPELSEAFKLRGGIRLALHDEAGAADDVKRALELKPEEADELTGEFTNVENQINQRYKNMNPYGF